MNADSDPAPIEQAATIPFRRRGDRLDFCLITSIKKGRWIFPKGIIDPGETYPQTALKEAHEEAGLRGKILDDPIGRYQYFKWGTTLYVTVVLMEVSAADEDWAEAEIRQRRWATADEARELIDDPQQRELLQKAVDRLNGHPRPGN